MNRYKRRRDEKQQRWNDHMMLYCGVAIVVAPILGVVLYWLYEAGHS
jgi:hypothetical protein